MVPSLKSRIADFGNRDASSYIAEYGRPFDPGSTDWDMRRWRDVERSLGLTDENEIAQARWYYMDVLIMRTAELCGLFDQ
jgi:hypothetical protein